MVDELMLRDVNNILKKLELIRTREDFSQIVIDNGLSNLSEEELNEALVTKFMTSEELALYKKYVLYKRREDLSNLVFSINALDELTSSIYESYEQNSRCRNTIKVISTIMEDVDRGLRDYPNIRVSTAYNRVKVNYKGYFDAYIKDGMDRAKFTEEIDDINRSSAIVRGLKKRRLKQLKEGLREHNKNSKQNIDSLYEGYISSRDDYGTYLREVMTKLLSKNNVLFEAGLLSLRSMYKEEIPVKVLPNGVTVVDRTKLGDVTPEHIANRAFEYFVTVDEAEFDEKMFIRTFRDFLLHFYMIEIERLNREAENALGNVREQFSKQKGLIGGMKSYQGAIDVPNTSLDIDTEDTMALIYRNNKGNK